MPPRAIKPQLACPIELTSGSFLIGRRGILVIPRNRLDRTWEGWAVSVPTEPAWSKSNEIPLQINVLQEFNPHALYQHCCGNSRLWIFTSRFFGNISLIFPRIFWQVRGSYTIQLLLIINSFHIENTRSLVFCADLVSFDHYIKTAFRIISAYGLHSWLFRAYWDIPENIHTPPMDNIRNPVRNAQYDWKSTNIPKFCKFNRNSKKTIQIFAKFWNSWRFWISRLWNSAKIAVVLLGNPQIFRYSIRCHPRGGGVDIFWKGPLSHAYLNLINQQAGTPVYILPYRHRPLHMWSSIRTNKSEDSSQYFQTIQKHRNFRKRWTFSSQKLWKFLSANFWEILGG